MCPSTVVVLACESITTAPDDVAKLDAASPVEILSAGTEDEIISFIFVKTLIYKQWSVKDKKPE